MDEKEIICQELLESSLSSQELLDLGVYPIEQPREKLLRRGAGSLKDSELLSLLLGSGSHQQPVRKLAQQVWLAVSQEPNTCSLEKLQKIKGMGLAKSAAILAVIELGRRIFAPNPLQVKHPDDVHRNIFHFADRQENFIALNLNGANEILSTRVVSRGTINRSLVHPREVFAAAVGQQAYAVIVAHNHPSGNLQPSTEDIQVTVRLQEAGQLLGIPLLDHIIFSPQAYYSMVEHGDMDAKI